MESIHIALFHIAQSALTIIITLIDQVSIFYHLNILGSIQSSCLLDVQRLAFWQYCALSDIGYPFTAGWTGEVLMRFEPGNFRKATAFSGVLCWKNIFLGVLRPPSETDRHTITNTFSYLYKYRYILVHFCRIIILCPSCRCRPRKFS